MFSFSRMITSVSAALALASLGSVLAVPVPQKAAPVAKRAVSIPSPAFVVYTDRFVSADVLPPADQVTGFNVVALSFLTLKGALDQAGAYAALAPDVKSAKKAEYAKAGINIIVSAFGETDKPTSQGADPVGTATTMAQFVLDQGLDGLDVDYEDLDAMNKGDGAAETWVTTFTSTLRKTLPQGQFILSHAPLAPWLSPNAQFAGGAYVTINKNVGSQIDFYNIQFYNQGLYTDCDGLINTAGAPFTGSALLEIPKNGFDLNKLVIGKPGGASDANNGFIDPQTLGTCVDQAKAKGFNGGVMAFQFPNADSKWIAAAKGSGAAAPAAPPAAPPATSAAAPPPATTAAAAPPAAPTTAAPSVAPGTQFITGPCTSDADCASGCCGFKSGLCAGAIVAQERDGGCGFGDAQPNDNAARKLRGEA